MAQSSDTQRLSRRYHNAYKRGNAIVHSGQWLQVIGVLLGVLFLAAVVPALIVLPTTLGIRGVDQDLVSIGAFVVGVIGAGAAFTLYRIGTVIAAHGEMLRAVLDIAVHTSPFLSEEQRGQIVLSPSGASKTSGYESVLGV